MSSTEELIFPTNEQLATDLRRHADHPRQIADITPFALRDIADRLDAAQAGLAARDSVYKLAHAIGNHVAAEYEDNPALDAMLAEMNDLRAQSPADALAAVKAEARREAFKEAADVCERIQADPEFHNPGQGVAAAKIVLRGMSTTPTEGARP
jgi:cell pole-organizing protein PopZ